MKVRTTHVIPGAISVVTVSLLALAFIAYRNRNPHRQQEPRLSSSLQRPFIPQRLSPTAFFTPPIDPLVKQLVLWASDFHISPVADIKQVVGSYGVHVVDKSLSGHCHLTNTCERDLKVINTQNGISLGPCPNRLRTAFHEAYRLDAQVRECRVADEGII